MLFKGLKRPGNYELEDLKKTEIPKLIDLFVKVFHKNWDDKFWNWFFYDHPYKTFSLALWDRDKLIGQYCGQEKKIIINDKPYNCVLGSTAVVDGDYRGEGLFIYMAKMMYNKLASMKYLLFYGFPNAAYNCGLYFKKFSWDFCEKKNILIKDLNIFSLKNESTQNTIVFAKIKKFPKQLDNHDFYPKNGIFILKDSEYLNWRFINHPLNTYECYLILNKSEEILGYFVLKTYINEKNEKFGEIDDYAILNSDPQIFSHLLEHVSYHFKKQGHDYLSIWCGVNSIFYTILKNNNFNEVEMPTSWGFITLQDLQAEFKKSLLTSENWNLRMGDSDVF